MYSNAESNMLCVRTRVVLKWRGPITQSHSAHLLPFQSSIVDTKVLSCAFSNVAMQNLIYNNNNNQSFFVF